MREVSCRATRMVLEVLDEAGVAVEALVDGLPVSLDQLRDPHARIDWNLFADVLTRLPDVCGEALSPEEIGERIAKVPSFDFLRRAGQLVVSPRQLYDVGFRLVTPALFANVSVRTEWLASDRVVITGELA